MRFPVPVKKVNNFLAIVSGSLITIMSCLAAMEVIARYVFHRPTSWSLNISQYLLIWAILLVAASTFEHKGHVSVDFIRTALARRAGVIWARGLAILGYCMCLVYIVVLGWKSTVLFLEALKLNKLTLGTIQIPVAYLYPAMMLGSILMGITIICIVLDLIGGGKEYLSEEDF